MNSETKQFIETHINQIENNGLSSTYLNCPLRILNDFNNSMHFAGIEYPPEIHVYVVVCCYVSGWFKDARLQRYDFEYGSKKEEFTFTCDNRLYDKHRFQQSLSHLLPKRAVTIDIENILLYTGNNILKIYVTVS